MANLGLGQVWQARANSAPKGPALNTSVIAAETAADIRYTAAKNSPHLEIFRKKGVEFSVEALMRAQKLNHT